MQNASTTFIEMISVSGSAESMRAHAIESSNYIQKGQMVLRGTMATANYIREANPLRYTILSVRGMQDAAPVRLMRIDSAGGSVTFITLDGKIRTARRYLCICDRMCVLESYLTQSRTCEYGATVKCLHAAV